MTTNHNNSESVLSRIRSAAESLPAKVVLTGTLLGLGGAGLAGCAEAAPAPSQSETVTAQTENEKLEASIVALPEPGTPEYEALFSGITVPYIEGQPATDVISGVDNAINNGWYVLGANLLPNTDDKLADWAFETRKTIDELTTIVLADGYWADGAAVELFGPNWKNDEETVAIVARFEDTHRNRLNSISQGTLRSDATTTVTDPGIKSESPTDIKFISTSTLEGAEGTSQIGAHIVATDVDGNGTLDKWIIVGPAN